MDENLKFLVLVVLYNKNLYSSETLASLIEQKSDLQNSLLLIWDNSPVPCLSNEELNIINDTFPNNKYIKTPENLALSSIYNQVIRGKEIENFKYLVLLDHDSDLDLNYFKVVTEATEAHPDMNLFLPIVYSNDEIVSPADLYYFKGIRWKHKQTGLVKSNWKAAINSGMVISTSYLKSLFKGYDERLKFYGTDTYFMQQYEKTNAYFYVLDTVIKHKLNYFEQEELEIKLNRFKEIKRSTSILNENSFIGSTFTQAYLGMFSILQAIRFRSLRFIYDYK